MSIIRHLGKGYVNGNEIVPSNIPQPTSRTFYFSEGSEGSSVNENVIWYVDGASTDNQYPYVYNATAEFTAELRFQNGYTIATPDDVQLSNDFTSSAYEWTISKSLNTEGDILTLTFTPDANDFNGDPVTISIDENNTVLVQPGEVWDLYDPLAGTVATTQTHSSLTVISQSGYNVNLASIEPNLHKYMKYDGALNNQIKPSNRYFNRVVFSETTSGLPQVGEYVFTVVGANAIYPYKVNAEYSFHEGSAGYMALYDDMNASSDDTGFNKNGLFRIQNLIRLDVNPNNGYIYVAEVIGELKYDEIAERPIIPFELNPTSSFLGDVTRFYLGNNYAARPSDNSVSLGASAGSYLDQLADYAKVFSVKEDGAWYDYIIDSISGNTITIQGTFNMYLNTSQDYKITFAPVGGKLVAPFYGFTNLLSGVMVAGANWASASNGSTQSINMTTSSGVWPRTGEGSLSDAFTGYTFTLNDVNGVDTQGITYAIDSITDNSLTIQPNSMEYAHPNDALYFTFSGQDWEGTANPIASPVVNKTFISAATSNFIHNYEWRIPLANHGLSVGQMVIVKNANAEEYHIGNVSRVDNANYFRIKSWQSNSPNFYELEIYQA